MIDGKGDEQNRQPPKVGVTHNAKGGAQVRARSRRIFLTMALAGAAGEQNERHGNEGDGT